MNSEDRKLSMEQRQIAVYIKTICQLSLAHQMKLRDKTECREYKRAMLAVIISIKTQTDQSKVSLQERESLMVKALHYLYREVKTNYELRKYSDSEAGETLLKEVVALMETASLVLPVQMTPDFTCSAPDIPVSNKFTQI